MAAAPVRSCAGCRTRRPQAELVRVAAQAGSGVTVDGRGPGLGGRRAPGRGAYVCPEPACVDAALRSGALERALRLKGRLPEGLAETLRSKIAGTTKRSKIAGTTKRSKIAGTKGRDG